MTDREVADKDELITLAQAAERYGFSHVHLRQLAQSGRLKATKLGRDWVTTPADMEEYIRSRRKTGRYRQDISVES
jgi:excisionase family DNA binding protein